MNLSLSIILLSANNQKYTISRFWAFKYCASLNKTKKLKRTPYTENALFHGVRFFKLSKLLLLLTTSSVKLVRNV